MIPVQKYINGCKSCANFMEGMECKVLELFLAEECPCHKCIVKTMCVEACEEYAKLTAVIDDEFSGHYHGWEDE